MTCLRRSLDDSRYTSMALNRQAAITAVFNRNHDELLWLAEVILGHDQDVEMCVVRARQLAEDGGVVSLDWLDPWVVRCLVRAAIERVHAHVQSVASDYTFRPQLAVMPLALNSEKRQVLRSIGSKEIFGVCNVLERAALVIHAYLGFSIQDSALLLDCHRSVIEPACANALQEILQTGLAFRPASKNYAGCRLGEAR